jgi:ankyrin repeat protein
MVYSLNRQARLNQSLVEAANQHDLPTVTRLLQAGADPNACDYPADSTRPFQRVLNWIHRVKPAAGARHTALQLVMNAHPGGFQYVTYALEDDPVFYGAFLSHGADPNVKDEDGATPLLCFVSQQVDKTAALFVEHGANVNIADVRGFTPLTFAAMKGDVEMTRLLLAHGADAQAKTTDRISVLSLERQSEREAVPGRETDFQAVRQLLLTSGAAK